jgi:hypothetical protein
MSSEKSLVDRLSRLVESQDVSLIHHYRLDPKNVHKHYSKSVALPPNRGDKDDRFMYGSTDKKRAAASARQYSREDAVFNGRVLEVKSERMYEALGVRCSYFTLDSSAFINTMDGTGAISRKKAGIRGYISYSTWAEALEKAGVEIVDKR